jgi:hypothetical protein
MGYFSLVTIASDTSPRVTKLAFDMPAALLIVWHDGTHSRHDLSPAIGIHLRPRVRRARHQPPYAEILRLG